MRRAIDIKKGLLQPTVAAAESREKTRRPAFQPLLCTTCAAIGILGGLSSLFAGLLCVIIHAVVAGGQAFDQVGTVLLILAIPMILTGSVFLDAIPSKQ